MGLNYKEAGVDVEAGYKAVKLMNQFVKQTHSKAVLTDIGGFGGLFSLDKDSYDKPVLVSGTDGVGTKLKLAFIMNKHDTIGIDCVAMCVNDILCCGAKPLFFLDYIGCGKNNPHKIASIVSGIAQGCKQAGASLIGGETAEMPGFYEGEDYDLAGFAVGIVDHDKILDGSKIKEGDVLIGLTSSGIHSNGYSFVRKVFNIDNDGNLLDKRLEGLDKSLGDTLLTPTKIYVNAISKLNDRIEIKSICHITGGGFIENVPRMLKDGYEAVIKDNTWPVPEIFNIIKNKGDIATKDMYNTFNMGIGMMIVVSKEEEDKALRILKELNEESYTIGYIRKGDKGVIMC